MSNVKPGDYAWIISSEYQENIGKVVKILTSPRYVMYACQWWYCHCENHKLTIDDLDHPNEGRTFKGQFADIADCDLKKITGPGALTEDEFIYEQIDLNYHEGSVAAILSPVAINCGER